MFYTQLGGKANRPGQLKQNESNSKASAVSIKQGKNATGSKLDVTSSKASSSSKTAIGGVKSKLNPPGKTSTQPQVNQLPLAVFEQNEVLLVDNRTYEKLQRQYQAEFAKTTASKSSSISKMSGGGSAMSNGNNSHLSAYKTESFVAHSKVISKAPELNPKMKNNK